MTRDGRQNDTPLLLGKIISLHVLIPTCFAPRWTTDAFYKNGNTIKGVDFPCSACAKCIKNRLYDPDPCEVCSQWLKHIKENSVEAENSGSLWVIWNRSLVSAWKHNKCQIISFLGLICLYGRTLKSSPSGSLCCRSVVRQRQQPPLLQMCPLCQTPAL